MNWDRRYNVSHFAAWNDNTISISELRRFNDIEVRIDSHSPHDSRNQKISVSFSDRDDSYNRMLLVKGLEYIKDHHRNIVAHKESVSKTVCDECREMLLQAEHLLWILLYIMND